MYFSDRGFFCSISFKILPKEDGVGEATKSRPKLVEKSYYVVGTSFWGLKIKNQLKFAVRSNFDAPTKYVLEGAVSVLISHSPIWDRCYIVKIY